MFKKPHFKIRMPSDEQKRSVQWWWNATDKVFKVFQWVFFVSLISYAADKTGSYVLGAVAILLSAMLFRFNVDLLSCFFEIGTESPKGRKVSSVAEFIVVLFMSTAILLVSQVVIARVINAFVDFQIKRL